MAPLPITSRNNPRIKAVRALHERRARTEQRAYLIEGVRLLLDALAAGVRPLLVLRDDSRLSEPHRPALDAALAAFTDIVQPVAPAVFDAVAGTESPQGVLAVVPLPATDVLPPPRPRDLYLIVDGVQDPGNLGTMLRSAEGAGVRCVVTTPGTVDLFSPKVVRAGMGAHFRLELAASMSWPAIGESITPVLPLLGATGAAQHSYDTIDWTRGAALIIGNEAVGLSDEARSRATALISIPLLGGIESLNAGVAAAVILFEAARQHRRAATDR